MTSIYRSNEQQVEARIEALAEEAIAAGDTAQLALCRRALSGDDEAQQACIDAIAAAEAMDEADRAIALSSAEDRIVHLDYDAEVATALCAQCSDWVENGDEIEYWNDDDDDDATWRVHMSND